MTRSLALVFTLALLWGASYPLLKTAVETIPPVTVAALRSLVAGLLLLAILSWRGNPPWRSGMGARAFVTQATFNCIIPWVLLAWAVRSIDAGLATILNSLSPIFVFLLTWAVTRHEAVTMRKFAGVALGIAGVLTIIGVDALAGVGQQTLAQLACVAGALSYAIAAIVGRRFDAQSPLVPAAGSTLAAAIVLLPIAFAFEQPWTLAPSTRSLAALLALSVFSTGLAFVVYFHLLSTIGSIATASQAYLRIVVGVGLSILFLGESLSTSVAIGLALVLAGVVAMTVPSRSAT